MRRRYVGQGLAWQLLTQLVGADTERLRRRVEPGAEPATPRTSGRASRSIRQPELLARISHRLLQLVGRHVQLTGDRREKLLPRRFHVGVRAGRRGRTGRLSGSGCDRLLRGGGAGRGAAKHQCRPANCQRRQRSLQFVACHRPSTSCVC